MNIIFMGMKHCGKSTHGKGIAKHYSIDFFDTDDLIILDYKRNSGKDFSIREVFSKYGEDAFKLKEEEILSKLSSYLSDGKSTIISLGGRLPLNDNITDVLKKLGFLIFIDVPVDVLYKRVMKKGIPPFLDENNPEKSFKNLYEIRKKKYYDLADLVVKVEDDSIKKIREILINKIEEYNDGR